MILDILSQLNITSKPSCFALPKNSLLHRRSFQTPIRNHSTKLHNSKSNRHASLRNNRSDPSPPTSTCQKKRTYSNVPGANRGIGLEFVRQLALDSSNTILACVRSPSTDQADLQNASSKSTHILTCDTGDLASIQSFAKEAFKTLGGAKIDYLINNAGINSVPAQTSLTLSPTDLSENMRINVLGPAKVTEYLLSADLLAPNVRIVNMSSGLGSMAVSLSLSPRKAATYSISKAGLNALTVQQSGEVRERLRECVVVCMDPGWVRTRMGGEGAVLEVEESVGGMVKCIRGLEEGSNGRFFTYTGEEVPW